MKFSSNLDEPAINESWGIRDLQISYEVCEGDCLTVTDELTKDSFNLNQLGFSPANPAKTSSTCHNGKPIVGGPSAFAPGQTVSRTFQGLPTHTEVTVHFLVFFFGEWDQERFFVSVDEHNSRSRLTVTDPLVSSGEEGSFCNSNGREEVRDVVITIPHSGEELTLFFFD